ncbi:MAG: hypothetical protein AB1898_30565 [Acidobacteriota bacterium]
MKEAEKETKFVRKSALTAPRKRLLGKMQEIGFGRIESLYFVGGEPRFDPPPRVIRTVKFGGENGSRPETGLADFLLKKEQVDLFNRLEALRSGVVERIEVQCGLPRFMEVQKGSTAQ